MKKNTDGIEQKVASSKAALADNSDKLEFYIFLINTILNDNYRLI